MTTSLIQCVNYRKHADFSFDFANIDPKDPYSALVYPYVAGRREGDVVEMGRFVCTPMEVLCRRFMDLEIVPRWGCLMHPASYQMMLHHDDFALAVFLETGALEDVEDFFLSAALGYEPCDVDWTPANCHKLQKMIESNGVLRKDIQADQLIRHGLAGGRLTDVPLYPVPPSIVIEIRDALEDQSPPNWFLQKLDNYIKILKSAEVPKYDAFAVGKYPRWSAPPDKLYLMAGIAQHLVFRPVADYGRVNYSVGDQSYGLYVPDFATGATEGDFDDLDRYNRRMKKSVTGGQSAPGAHSMEKGKSKLSLIPTFTEYHEVTSPPGNMAVHVATHCVPPSAVYVNRHGPVTCEADVMPYLSKDPIRTELPINQPYGLLDLGYVDQAYHPPDGEANTSLFCFDGAIVDEACDDVISKTVKHCRLMRCAINAYGNDRFLHGPFILKYRAGIDFEMLSMLACGPFLRRYYMFRSYAGVGDEWYLIGIPTRSGAELHGATVAYTYDSISRCLVKLRATYKPRPPCPVINPQLALRNYSFDCVRPNSKTSGIDLSHIMMFESRDRVTLDIPCMSTMPRLDEKVDSSALSEEYLRLLQIWLTAQGSDSYLTWNLSKASDILGTSDQRLRAISPAFGVRHHDMIRHAVGRATVVVLTWKNVEGIAYRVAFIWGQTSAFAAVTQRRWAIINLIASLLNNVKLSFK